MGEPELTVKQAARQLAASERTVRDWLRRGKLQGRRIRGKKGEEWRVTLQAVRDMAAGDAAKRRGTRRSTADALLAEVRSLREENAAYRDHLERLTVEVMGLREAVQRLLPPAPEPQAQTANWWQRVWRRS